MGGLQRTWDKIKAYLTNWKTTNFGTGTYSNSGSIVIDNTSRINMNNESVISIKGVRLYLKLNNDVNDPGYFSIKYPSVYVYFTNKSSVTINNVSGVSLVVVCLSAGVSERKEVNVGMSAIFSVTSKTPFIIIASTQ